MSSDAESNHQEHPGTPGEGNRFWENLLRLFTDLSPNDFTHLANDGHSLSRIDYVFSSLPSWKLAGTHLHAKVIDEFSVLAARRLSDHAPLIASVAFKDRIPASSRPIPSFVSESKAFRADHDYLTSIINLDDMPIRRRRKTHKLILQVAGRTARNTYLKDLPTDERSEAMIVSSIARAVARNDITLASLLMRRSLLASASLEIIGNRIRLIRRMVGVRTARTVGVRHRRNFLENKLLTGEAYACDLRIQPDSLPHSTLRNRH